MYSELRVHFIFLLLVALKTGEGAIWRYHSDFGDDRSLPVNVNVYVMYMGNISPTSWSLTSTPICSIQQSTVACSKSGLFKISISENGVSSDKTFKFEKKPWCHHWFMSRTSMEVHMSMSKADFLHSIDEKVGVDAEYKCVHSQAEESHSNSDYSRLHSIIRPHTLENISTWVIDPLMASDLEIQGAATQPSQNSIRLSRQYHQLGQEPLIACYDETIIHFTEALGFDDQAGVWRFSVHWWGDDQPHYLVTGHSVALYNCFIKDSHILLPRPVIGINKYIDQTSSIHFGVKDVQLSIIIDSGIKNIALLVHGNTMWLTQDGFVTVDQFSPTLTDPKFTADHEITKVSFSSSNLVILSNKSVFIMDKETMQVTFVEDLEDIIGIKGESHNFYYVTKQSGYGDDMYVAWSESNVYLMTSHNILQTLDVTDMLMDKAVSHSIVQITDVSFSPNYGWLGILTNVTNHTGTTSLIVLHYDFWHDTSLIDHHQPTTSEIKLQYIEAGEVSYFLWTDTDIYYSLWAGTQQGYLQKMGGTSLVALDTTIKQLLVGKNGEVIVLTSHNHILYGTVGTQLVQLQSWSMPDAENSLWLDDVGRLYVLAPINATIDKNLYPLQHEVATTLDRYGTCPFLHLSHNIKSYYDLDIGQTITFWVNIIYKEDTPNPIQVVMPSSTYINVSESVTYDYGNGLIAEKMTLTLLHIESSVDSGIYLQTLKQQMTVFTVEFKPTQISVVCKDPVRVLTQVFVGCHTERKIKVKEIGSGCSYFDKYTLLPGTYLDELGSVATRSKDVPYDFELLGCPIKLHYGTKFSPTLQLLRSGKYQGEVTGNFIVWEKHNRLGYSYNATMMEAGCLQVAQTWRSMKASAHPGTDIKDVWGPINYEGCYDAISEDSSMNLDQPYEILNSTGHSTLTFEGITEETDSGIYIFNIKLIDPQESFCTLTTQVAIAVYDSPLDVKAKLIPMAGSVVTFFVLAVLVLVTSYFYFCLLGTHHWKPFVSLQHEPSKHSKIGLPSQQDK